MLRKIISKQAQEQCVYLYNTFIKAYFDDFLDENERKELSFDVDFSDFHGKEWYFYIFQDEKIGICSYKYKTDTIAYISEFHILPQFQRKGFGTLMMDELCDFLSWKGVELVCLETYYKYTHAIAFYQKYGFEYISPDNLKALPLKDVYDFLVEKSMMFCKRMER